MLLLGQCPACGNQIGMTARRVRSKCGADLPPISAHLQAEFDSQNDLLAGCDFIIEIEDRFGVEIPEEVFKYLRDADAICSFILNCQPIGLGRPGRQDILIALREAAEKYLDIKHSSPQSDLLERLRKVLEKPRTAHAGLDNCTSSCCPKIE